MVEHNNKVSETAYYCCGVRMVDALSPTSLINDRYAHRFMDEHGQEIFSRLRHLKNTYICSIVRARIVDEYLRELLIDNKDTQVVVLGAGFDTKAFRIAGGVWYEIDETHIIAKKNDILPTPLCPNPLQRISVDFAKNGLIDALSCLDKNKTTVFIIEGVLMYLEDSTIHQMLELLKHHFAHHTVIADLMSAPFIDKYMKKFLYEINQLGCSFKFYHHEPKDLFLTAGYRAKSTTSIIGRAVELKQMHAPKPLLKVFYAHALDGYSVNVLEYRKP